MTPPSSAPTQTRFQQVFGDLRAELLEKFEKGELPKGEEASVKKSAVIATALPFHLIGGLFQFFGPKVPVVFQGRAVYVERGTEKDVAFREIHLKFSAPSWGKRSFFFQEDESTPSGIRLTDFPSAEELKKNWCAKMVGNGKTVDGGRAPCAKDPQSDYYQYADPVEEGWVASAIQYVAFKEIVIVPDGDEQPNIYGVWIFDGRMKLPLGMGFSEPTAAHWQAELSDQLFAEIRAESKNSNGKTSFNLYKSITAGHPAEQDALPFAEVLMERFHGE